MSIKIPAKCQGAFIFPNGCEIMGEKVFPYFELAETFKHSGGRGEFYTVSFPDDSIFEFGSITNDKSQRLIVKLKGKNEWIENRYYIHCFIKPDGTSINFPVNCRLKEKISFTKHEQT